MERQTLLPDPKISDFFANSVEKALADSPKQTEAHNFYPTEEIRTRLEFTGWVFSFLIV